jgi:hypothetical protein
MRTFCLQTYFVIYKSTIYHSPEYDNLQIYVMTLQPSVRGHILKLCTHFKNNITLPRRSAILHIIFPHED